MAEKRTLIYRNARTAARHCECPHDIDDEIEVGSIVTPICPLCGLPLGITGAASTAGPKEGRGEDYLFTPNSTWIIKPKEETPQ